jgi:glyoxylase-like metal-dependent hydrolase (beta-lactamase superfamily II)
VTSAPVSEDREVLAVRYAHRVTTRAESYLNFHLYGEPDGDMGLDAGDVTAVVLTHAHWDHVGNLREFPRANIVMAAAEYAFWTSPLAARWQFAAQAEPDELALLAQARAEDRLTLVAGQHTLAPGVELIEVGGHTPGQLIVSVTTRGGPVTPASTVVLASDAMHFYEEVERDRPFAVRTDLPGMYRAYDTLAQLAGQPGTRLVAGHDPAVRDRNVSSPPGSQESANGRGQETGVTQVGIGRNNSGFLSRIQH